MSTIPIPGLGIGTGAMGKAAKEITNKSTFSAKQSAQADKMLGPLMEQLNLGKDDLRGGASVQDIKGMSDALSLSGKDPGTINKNFWNAAHNASKGKKITYTGEFADSVNKWMRTDGMAQHLKDNGGVSDIDTKNPVMTPKLSKYIDVMMKEGFAINNPNLTSGKTSLNSSTSWQAKN